MTFLLLIAIGFTTWQGLNTPGVMTKYLFSTEAIRFRKEWIRLVSPGFLHANWNHFFGNAITLYFFGSYLEQAGGAGFMAGIFFGSVIGGHLLCMLLYPKSDYRAVGASGGTLGLLFSTIIIYPSVSIFIIPGWLYGLIYLFYTLSSLRGGSGISHEAHLGGMLSGILLTLVRAPLLFRENPLLICLFLGISAGGLWYLHANPGRVPGFLGFQVKSKINDFKQAQHQRSEDQLDSLLDKVSKHGIQSLSNRERQLLQDASKKRGARR